MKLYSVTNWDEHYENNRTRGMKVMQWVPVPNKHDGEGYTDLLGQPNGTTLYGAWHLILQVASKCKKRGVLLKDTGIPHDAASIAAKTRGSLKAIAEALEVCTRIGWITATEWSGQTYSDPAVCPQVSRSLPAVCPHPTDEEGKEGKGMEGRETDMSPSAAVGPESEDTPHKAFVSAWNALGKPFAKIEDWHPKRQQMLRSRWGEPYFREHWQDALQVMQRLNWCRGETDRGWVANVEYFLKPGKVANLIEQKGQSSAGRVIGRKMTTEQRNDLYEGIPT